MHFTTVMTALFGVLAAAVPVKRQQAYGTSINAIVSSGLDAQKVQEPIPMQFNSLLQLDNLPVSGAILDTNATYGVNPRQVECQFYMDTQGVKPAGLALNYTSTPVEFTTNLVEVNSVICIVKLADQS